MREELPLVSILTPSLNKGRFIEETILSIKNQTYARIEHIVIDGGSTDGTLDILRKYDDSGLVWVSEPDKGQYDASNKGFRMAKGEILGWLMADDTYMPQTVETAVKFFISNPDVVMVYGNCTFIDEEGKVIREFPSAPFDLPRLVRGPNIIPSPTVFFRKHVLARVGYFDTNLHMSADYDLFIRVALKFKIEYIPELLATYRLYPGTKTTAEFNKFLPDYLYIYDRLFSRQELPKKVRDVRRQAYANAYLDQAEVYYQFGWVPGGRKYLTKALLMYPALLKKRRILGYATISYFPFLRIRKMLSSIVALIKRIVGGRSFLH